MAEQLRIAVVGASGYTGGELLRLLSLHPKITISHIVASSKSEGLVVPSILPSLTKIIDAKFAPLNGPKIAQEIDLVFLALPHTQSLEPVAEFLSCQKMVIDLSADYRLQNPKTYEHWYQAVHPYPELLKQAVYGLPELHRSAIRQSRLVAVPGCYPTAAILQLAPFLSRKLIEPTSIIIDAKSGVSGAGRSPGQSFHFPEAHEALHAYKIAAHRHIPEIEQELNQIFSLSNHRPSPPLSLVFTPHLIPMNRGILSTAYAKIQPKVETAEIATVYQNFYQDEPFIRVFDQAESVNPRNIRGANFCDLSCTYDTRSNYLIGTGAIDNLVKGAAGQAIQCMNLMFGFPETLGLTGPGVFP